MNQLEGRLQRLEQQQKASALAEPIDRIVIVALTREGEEAPEDDPENIVIDVVPAPR